MDDGLDRWAFKSAVKTGTTYRKLLERVLAVADRGQFRDGAGLGLHAHPIMDDVREALNPSDK